MTHHDHHHEHDPAREHRARGPAQVSCWVLTISDTKTEETDVSGDEIRDQLTRGGHQVQASRIVKDEPHQIRGAILDAIDAGAQAVVCTGGTGLTSRDSTFEVLSDMLERPLPGFGELFRMLSWEQIKSAAMMSRAIAGVLQGTIVFALPGSPKGVALGMEKLIVPELSHVLEQLGR